MIIPHTVTEAQVERGNGFEVARRGCFCKLQCQHEEGVGFLSVPFRFPQPLGCFFHRSWIGGGSAIVRDAQSTVGVNGEVGAVSEESYSAELPPTLARTCKATTKSGEPCRSKAVLPSGYCYNHDPDLVAEREESRSRGGKETARVRSQFPKAVLLDTQEQLREVLAGVIAQEIPPDRAAAVAALSRALVAVVGERNTEPLADLEERVAEVEAVVYGGES